MFQKTTTKPLRRALLFTAGAAAGMWVLAQWMPPCGTVPGTNIFRATLAHRPWVIAHAGGLGLAPENTLEAFTASAAVGCDMLEMDLRLTKDGVLVTHHDATVERTSNGSGAVLEHTVAELKGLNFGYHFHDSAGAHPYREKAARLATLEELFQRFGPMPMNLELKDRGDAGRRAGVVLAALLLQHRMNNRVLVASFDDATLEAFRQASQGKVATSTARGETRKFVLLGLMGLDRLWSGRVAAAQVPCDTRQSSGLRLARTGFVRAAHARNMAVHYWTVNEPHEMRRLVELGADGIITDYPDRLAAVLREAIR